MLLNPLLVATGITITQITGVSFLESVGACLLALSMILIALLNLFCIVPATAPLLARGLLAFSSTAVAITMLFAGAYALGNVTGFWTITIAQMIVIHGWVNALVFEVCRAWEASTTHIPTRRCIVRTGLVLDTHEGAFPPLLHFAQLLGSQLGDGQQWIPWIHKVVYLCYTT